MESKSVSCYAIRSS